MKDGRPTHYREEITVAGSGRFPLDMLRYDRCIPKMQSDVAAIAETRGHRVVWLYRYVEGHLLRPSVDRWASFGWHVLRPEEIEAYAAAGLVDLGDGIKTLGRALASRGIEL